MAKKSKSSEPKQKKEKAKGKRLGEKLVDILQLPSEVLLNLPRFTIVGNKELYIENYKGIIEYKDVCIRVNTSLGVVRIEGRGLSVKNITSEDICVLGAIELVEFIR